MNNVLPFCLFVWGQTHIASGLAAILNSTTPFAAIALAHYLTRDEKATSVRVIGVIIGFAGIVVAIGAGAFEGLGTQVLAQLACVAGALSYAYAGVYARCFESMGTKPLTAATGQVTASAIVLVPLAVIFDRPWELPAPSSLTWVAILGSAILSTALGYILYFRILSTAGATNLLLVTFLVPISAITLGSVFLGEKLQSHHYFGVAIVAVGLAVIDGRFIRHFRTQK
jgi:drug/metabolite transporter (DMT)-like permease